MTEKEVLKYFEEVDKLLALQEPNKALEIVEKVKKELKDNQKWLLGRAYFWEQLCYKHLSDLKNSLKAAESAVKIFGSLNSPIEISKIYRNSGLSYEYVGLLSKGIKEIEKSNEVLAEAGYVDALGINFSKIGQLYLKQGKLVEAEKYCKLGYEICKYGKNKFFLLTTILPLTLISYENENLIYGLDLIEEAERLLRDEKKKKGYINNRRLGEVYLRKALIFFSLKDMKSSIKNTVLFSKICLTTTKEERKVFMEDVYVKKLFDLHEEKGNFGTISKYLSKSGIRLTDILKEVQLKKP